MFVYESTVRAPGHPDRHADRHADRHPDPQRASVALLGRAHDALDDARTAESAADRFSAAHLAALRAAAAVLAARGRPGSRRRLTSAWVLISTVAPEFAEWASYFSATARIRSVVEAGAVSAVNMRAADDEVRAAAEFVSRVESALGLLPLAS